MKRISLNILKALIKHNGDCHAALKNNSCLGCPFHKRVKLGINECIALPGIPMTIKGINKRILDKAQRLLMDYTFEKRVLK